MIKKCKVISRNSLVMVVLYDSTEVQLPSDQTDCTEVFIRKTDNNYVLSSEEEFTKTSKRTYKKISGAELAEADTIKSDNKSADNETNIS
ncbi:hypothetical protein [Hungatella hathewayi]|uniref:hypothetical protein n=1 Tax=Hungatella hathewayi TaxID=154046 RepID=UPI0035636A07